MKKSKSFYCDLCDYSCIVERDYKKHIETMKHRTHLIANTKIEKKTYDCVCGKVYSHMSSLSKHRSKCDQYNKFISSAKNINVNTYEHQPGSDTSNNISEHKQILQDLLSQSKKEMRSLIQEEARELFSEGNRELRNFLVNEINAFHKEQQEQYQLHQQSAVLMQNNMYISNKNINNNNKISLNIVLDQTCNNALNINEFIDTLEIDSDTLDYTGKQGYVAGITKIFLDGLKRLDVKQRPIHCTDASREIFYVRDNNQWGKDDANNTQLKNAITKVADTNFFKIDDWKKKYPQSNIVDTPEYEYHFVLMRNAIGISKIKREKGNNEIIKNLAKAVHLSRDELTSIKKNMQIGYMVDNDN